MLGQSRMSTTGHAMTPHSRYPSSMIFAVSGELGQAPTFALSARVTRWSSSLELKFGSLGGSRPDDLISDVAHDAPPGQDGVEVDVVGVEELACQTE